MAFYEARLATLTENLGRSEALAAEADGILESFNERLGRLQEAVLPVQARPTLLMCLYHN